jgi:hypothetical protein
MKIIALITAAYLPGTFIAVSRCIEGVSHLVLTFADHVQHEYV